MPADSSHELRRAITHLYGTFKKYRSDNLFGCSCCVSDAESRRLAVASLKSLSAADLDHYARSAMSTWGDVDDFKHFLPRVFELAAAGEEPLPDIEIVLAKPGYGRWTNWPSHEQQAITNYFRALWLDLLDRHPHPLEADACLCGIAGSVDDVQPLLEAWSDRHDRPAMMHLADFIGWNSSHPRSSCLRTRLANAFWSDRREQAEVVWRWLLQPARREQLELAFFDADNDEVRGAFSAALDGLGLLNPGV